MSEYLRAAHAGDPIDRIKPDLTWPWSPGASSCYKVIHGKVRRAADLPFFCNPIGLFLAMWVLMLGCLSVHVSYVIYPYFGTPILIFAVSAGALLLGYFAITAVLDDSSEKQSTGAYVLNVTEMWRLNLLFCSGAMLLIAMNWTMSGPPPVVGDPSSYLSYGRLKQILFPLLTTVGVNATLDSSRLRRLLFVAFSLSVLIMYVARGVLLLMFVQMFFLYSVRSRMGRKKQYVVACAAFGVAIAVATIFGNLRTAHDVFIEFLEIREKYVEWPMSWLWLVSYVSIPFSNLCWIVARVPMHVPTFSFLYSLLPTFAAPESPYTGTYSSTFIVDNASTYLQNYALDFAYPGIFFANLLLGAGCGWVAKRAYPKHPLILSMFLASMVFIFFTDMFLLLSTVIQVLLQVWVERRCLQWSASPVPSVAR